MAFLSYLTGLRHRDGAAVLSLWEKKMGWKIYWVVMLVAGVSMVGYAYDAGMRGPSLFAALAVTVVLFLVVAGALKRGSR